MASFVCNFLCLYRAYAVEQHPLQSTQLAAHVHTCHCPAHALVLTQLNMQHVSVYESRLPQDLPSQDVPDHLLDLFDSDLALRHHKLPPAFTQL